MKFFIITLIFASIINANNAFTNIQNRLKIQRISNNVFENAPLALPDTSLYVKSGRFRPHVSPKDVLRNIRRKQRTDYISSLHKRYRKDHLQQQLTSRGGSTLDDPKKGSKSNVRMYIWCLLVTLVWISSGTIFYSLYNEWPLAQSFFYAVDAGMSIGFCTDVFEAKVGSRAFTIVFILLGASCVGGALALFVKDILEGIVDLRHDKFEQLLAAHAARRYQNKQGKLTYADFRLLIEEWSNSKLSDEAFGKICSRFDRSGKGLIRSKLFVQKCQEMELLLNTDGPLYSSNIFVRKYAQLKEILRELFDAKIYRIFTVFVLWLGTGICWGHFRQGWDWITATHFAVSALATGGLTGPDVNAIGILPTEPALFCGIFCLFGIPLFALTLGHSARILVEGYIAAVEEKAVIQCINEPIDITEFEYAKHLCSVDEEIHLSDFLVLQLLRQGKIDIRTVELIKQQFDLLDEDKSGKISFQEAMSRTCIPRFPSTLTDAMDSA